MVNLRTKAKMVYNEVCWQNEEININTQNPEFLEWKWIEFKKLPEIAVNFKKKFIQK